MAKTKDIYKRTITTTDATKIVGVLNEDGKTIIDEDGILSVNLLEKLKRFIGKTIEISISEKTVEDLSHETETEEEETDEE